jgi:hypothetical protein
MPKFKVQLVVIVLLLSGVMVALAGSPHFIGTLSFSSGSFHVTGDLAGLGNTSITVRLDAYANVTASCQNGGGTVAPGRNPIHLSTVVTTSVVPDANGRTSIELVAQDPLTASPLPPSPSSKAAGCPNGNWKVVGFVPGSTQWTGALISVTDNGTGALLLQQRYACTGAGTSLTCTQI